MTHEYPDVTIVDENDEIVGSMQRNDAIRLGKIYRISVVCLFNSAGELFLQKRGPNIELPNLWCESAGGHVDKDEDYQTAAARELEEELGITNVTLTEVATFYSESPHGQYVAKKFFKVFKGVSENPVTINREEIADGAWLSMAEIAKRLKDNPEQFIRIFPKIFKYVTEKSKIT
jgi:isopentenyl-diphosphate delta-isomerase